MFTITMQTRSSFVPVNVFTALMFAWYFEVYIPAIVYVQKYFSWGWYTALPRVELGPCPLKLDYCTDAEMLKLVASQMLKLQVIM